MFLESFLESCGEIVYYGKRGAVGDGEGNWGSGSAGYKKRIKERDVR